MGKDDKYAELKIFQEKKRKPKNARENKHRKASFWGRNLHSRANSSNDVKSSHKKETEDGERRNDSQQELAQYCTSEPKSGFCFVLKISAEEQRKICSPDLARVYHSIRDSNEFRI